MYSSLIKQAEKALKEEKKISVSDYKPFIESERGEKLTKEEVLNEIENADTYDTWENVLFSQGYFLGMERVIDMIKSEERKSKGDTYANDPNHNWHD